MTSALTSLFNDILPKAIFFDLDGTLIDSIPDLAAAVDAMLVEYHFSPAGVENCRLWVGNGAEKLVLRALAHAKGLSEKNIPPAELAQALKLSLQKYAECHGKLSKLYPGVIQTLRSLQSSGIRLCIITNKPKQFTPTVLASHSLTNFFELVLSGDSLVEMKPSPVPILHAIKEMGLSKNDVLMVGDSKSDILAANAAGIKSVCVTYGYNHGVDPNTLPASIHINSFSQLIA